MDLVTIQYKPIEVPNSMRKGERISLHRMTIPDLQAILDKHVKDFQDQGFHLFLLDFESGSEDEPPTMVITASRLETEEEMQQRIKRHEAYNARQVTEHAAKVEASKRAKEIKRLTAHLTLEQLQAASSVK